MRLAKGLRLAAAILMAGALAVPALPAFADDARDFSIVNAGTKAITEVYVARSSSSEWGDNILSLGPIDPGETRNIVFSYPAPGVCEYDFHDVGADGSTGTLLGLNLCEISVVTDDGATVSAS
jgi:hypothetical protein